MKTNETLQQLAETIEQRKSAKADESYVYEDSITAVHDPTEDTNYGWAIVINRYTGAISYGERLWSKENTYTGKCKKDIKRKF